MKATTYLKFAKNNLGRVKVVASAKADSTPVNDSYGKPLPTVYFAVDFNIPDELFEQASNVIASIDVQSQDVKIAGGVQRPTSVIKINKKSS